MEKLFVQHFYIKLLFNKTIFITLSGIYIPNSGVFSSCIYTNYPVVRLVIRIIDKFV